MSAAAGNPSRDLRAAMNLSMAVGLMMLFGKIAAWRLTGSAAILSDAAESVVHVVAVAFASYSLRLSSKPPDKNHLYGHGKISFFSAGFEGAMIILAAIYILYEAVEKWILGFEIENLGWGSLLTLAAALINAVLGGYLLWTGKRRGSLILEANGKHVLTDCWTSIGVLLALAMIAMTGWPLWDPIFAILLALNILWSGVQLVSRSLGGLMDVADPAMDRQLKDILTEETTHHDIQFHDLRHRFDGDRLYVDCHLLFPTQITVGKAHEIATQIERAIEARIAPRTSVNTHLEPLESHERDHRHDPHG